jgi:uncharacterized protein (DUF362 family)/ferredoxin
MRLAPPHSLGRPLAGAAGAGRGAAGRGVVVAAALNPTHALDSVAAAFPRLLDHLDPPLPRLVTRGARVLVKVNMGCKGVRDPAERYTSHPTFVEAIIRALLDCGATVSFGDDVSRTAIYPVIWKKTGMLDVARRTGATLVDFTAAGGTEVRGRLLYPRTHLVTNAVRDAEVIVNAASCRSHAGVVLSGAVKNMFGVVLGARRYRLHALLPNKSDFARALVDICRVAPPAVSFLDLTTVLEGHGVEPAIRPVGLLLGSADPVAIDTVAQHAIGYDALPLWTSIHGARAGLGCNHPERIQVRGVDGHGLKRARLRPPDLSGLEFEESMPARLSRVLNNTLLRPRPVITSERCTGCGACADRCPVQAIRPVGGRYAIDHRTCGDCGCCAKVCEAQAIDLRFVGLGRVVRSVARR